MHLHICILHEPTCAWDIQRVASLRMFILHPDTNPQRQCYAAGRAASVLFENARCSTVSWRLLKGTGCLRGKSKLYNCGVQWQSPVQTLIQVVLRVLQFTVCQHQLPNQMRHGSSVPPGTYVAH